MKIDLNKINRKDIDNLLLEKEMNIAAAQGLFDYCFYTRDNPLNKNDILDYLELNLSNKEDKYFYVDFHGPGSYFYPVSHMEKRFLHGEQ